MSSFLGHIASGAAVYLAQKHRQQKSGWLLPVLILLAIFPDLDYLAFWFFDINFEPRFSHSLWVCLGISGIAWLATWRFRIPFTMFALASFSHLLLDFLVGVHPLPLLWPFSHHEIMSPFGLLPSAGRLNLGNYYFWRNLFIESGILLPILNFWVLLSQNGSFRMLPKRAWMLLPITIICLFWSISLPR